MDWTTLYIKGKRGFKPLVLARMKGVILHGSSQPNHEVLLVWIKCAKTLRSLKLLIGADLIFRYRLHFFTDLNEHLESKEVNDKQFLSARETEMLREIRAVSKKFRDSKSEASYVNSLPEN